MKLWAAGRVLESHEDPRKQPWALRGVFDTEELARAACTGDLDFVGPFQPNTLLEECVWPDAYFPNRVKTTL